MEPKVDDTMKVSPQLTAQADWIDGEVIDVEHNPFMGLVISDGSCSFPFNPE